MNMIEKIAKAGKAAQKLTAIRNKIGTPELPKTLSSSVGKIPKLKGAQKPTTPLPTPGF